MKIAQILLKRLPKAIKNLRESAQSAEIRVLFRRCTVEKTAIEIDNRGTFSAENATEQNELENLVFY